MPVDPRTQTGWVYLYTYPDGASQWQSIGWFHHLAEAEYYLIHNRSDVGWFYSWPSVPSFDESDWLGRALYGRFDVSPTIGRFVSEQNGGL